MIATVLGAIGAIGDWVLNLFARVGFVARSFATLMGRAPGAWRRPALISEQIHFIGNYSLLIIAVSGLFVGMVLALQGYYNLSQFGAEEKLGQLVALSLLRELGPVVTALLFAGRAGTSLTAEIGLMKAGEQLSAMEMMAVNPIQRVLAPRFWAGVVAMPVLATVFSAIGVIGGYLVGVKLIGIDAGAFWSQMQGNIDVRNDVLNGVIKSVVFGAAVTFTALFQGYEAQPTPEGVSRATTRTVVVASLMVLALDFIMTALMFNK
jgi:phospholipid/cholesterol/gamma-HCH transport system permease protein